MQVFRWWPGAAGVVIQRAVAGGGPVVASESWTSADAMPDGLSHAVPAGLGRVRAAGPARDPINVEHPRCVEEKHVLRVFFLHALQGFRAEGAAHIRHIRHEGIGGMEEGGPGGPARAAR